MFAELRHSGSKGHGHGHVFGARLGAPAPGCILLPRVRMGDEAEAQFHLGCADKDSGLQFLLANRPGFRHASAGDFLRRQFCCLPRCA